ncbi:hypothetical protein [Sandarakinorhabdus sp.]|uniref:hypothetical protein n=1 Tax=Sandarakinorhabdus sp. TaxID=1916663 RepID=UPI003340DD5E
MFQLQIKKRIAMALVSQIAVEAAATQCDMFLEDKHNYEVVSGSGLGVLGALVPGGALLTGVAAGLATVASDSVISSNKGNDSEKEIVLRDFLRKTQPKPEMADLNKIGFRMLSENVSPADCRIVATIKKSRLVGGRYGGDTIEQTFDIVRISNGDTAEISDLRIDSVVRLLIFQPKPPKRLKEDSRTGKYIDVTSPMIDADVYNQKVANLYSKVTVKHLSLALKKAKFADK